MTTRPPGRPHLLVFGLGYSGAAVARDALSAGYDVTATSRDPRSLPPAAGGASPTLVAFAQAHEAVGRATHVLVTAPPDEAGDPVLARYGAALAVAPRLGWIGYLSTTGVYGDHAGGWVDEDTPPRAAAGRAGRRVAAELAWRELAQAGAAGGRLDLVRLAGIYGPGRSVLDELRAGTARCVVKPGHAFGRIHRDDIAGAVLAAMAQREVAGVRVLNGADDLPAERAAVLAEGARLLGLPVPPAVPFAQAEAGMSAMARSFWADSRRVASARTQARLGRVWRYPTYREGLRAVLAAEGGPCGRLRPPDPRPGGSASWTSAGD